ncbi:hypothetical protein A3D81_00150 [Candidatus Curtissbacteria bacterium RIFCSPHIGHO2_02_FULL_40_17]|uniref:Membrane protein 6-pyruvoyl-tetrahydropterin synthase-related domain-containing protein n=3 Tax=Candidatus Curtissiibacteriota TaxID=1752717 RepID=A0A1F5GHA4_9BACT|nr:MAG: hypothetical protein A2693_00040 [Candidatus Curtissbacteria bacterium RIFCSPHIGHO2_01_FULL_40_12]OGD91242.1 MAG: hypothetical protein A3D81_00150 [Candidatus Curtissbacteria bacterium RIFCSPHIGHO2_02_FULL_40_17]OGE07877.1 MAG: hypothetical protein A3I53_04300 [Candidatus Curtissbacteria bacterium RIFCSPLOWO2_02_FULL_40_13b]
MIKKIINIFPFLILLILTIVFFGNTLTGKEVFVTPDFGRSDILHAEYPTKLFLSESLKNKQLPLWNPYIASGFPQLGTITGNFNPINLIAFYLLPMPLAFNISLAFSFLIAGIFTFLFARSIGLSRITSLFAAIIFSYSGFFITQITHFVVIQTLSFFPLTLFLTELFIQKKKPIFVPLLSIVFGLQILAGFYQIVLYSIIVILLYSLFRIFSEPRYYRWRLFLGILSAVSAGFLLSAIQLFPSWELTQISNRKGGVSFEEVKLFPYQIKHLVTFIWPYLLGDPRIGSYPRFSQNWGIFWESTGYVGVLPLLFTIVAIAFSFKKSRVVKFFTFLLIFSLLLMLGKNSPTIFFFKIPPLSFFRVPSRWIVFFALSLSILGAIGLEILLGYLNSTFRKRWTVLLIGFILLLLTSLNIFIFAGKYHLRGRTDEWLSLPLTAEFLLKDNNDFKILTVGSENVWNEEFLNRGWKNSKDKYLVFRESLDPNWNSVFKIRSVKSYSPVSFKNDLTVSSIFDQEIIISQNGVLIGPSARNLLDIEGAKYVISPFSITDNDLEKVFESKTNPNYFVYLNKRFLPLVGIFSEYAVGKNPNEQFQLLNTKSFNPKSTLILEKDIGQKFAETSSEAKIVNYQNNLVEIEALMKENGILVLRDSMYPGWKAYVDGQEKEILAANINQRALVLDKGEHQVKFVYQPKSFKIGAIISILAFLMLIITFIFTFLKDKLRHNEYQKTQ